MFKTFSQDNATSEVNIAGARSRGTSNQDIATLTFRNYDADTSNTYKLGAISGRDAFGNAASNGFGNIVFSTNATGTLGNVLKDQMVIDYRGYVGINKLDPAVHLDINGSVAIASNLSAPVITSLSNSLIGLSNYTYTLPTSTGQLDASQTAKLIYSSNAATFSSNALQYLQPIPVISPRDVATTDFIQVYSWIIGSNVTLPSTLLVNSYLVENDVSEVSSSNFLYTLRVYDSTNNMYLGLFTLSNNLPTIYAFSMSNMVSTWRSTIELHAKKNTALGAFLRVNTISFS